MADSCESPMPVYTCPECSTKLKRAEPLPAGKKLRCPECGVAFAPAKSKAAAAQATPAKSVEEEKDVYTFTRDDRDEADADARAEAAFKPIKDRFERSARGPALIRVVRPSDWLLFSGAAICVAAIVGAIWAIFPLVFQLEEVQPPDKNSKVFRPASTEKRRFKELSPDEFNMRFVYLGCFVGQFLWGTAVCVGASKMHTLESYPLAMIGSIMGLVGFGVPAGVFLLINAIQDDEAYLVFLSILLIALPGLPLTTWCVATLRNKEVIDGFAEEKPEEYVGDRLIS